MSTTSIKLDPSLFVPKYGIADVATALKKIKAMEQRNAIRNAEKAKYVYRPPMGTPLTVKMMNPEAFSTRSLTESQQVSELVRMAKMHAQTVRQNKNDIEYEKERDKFMSQYSPQISKYNLYTKMNEIFNLFKDPKYSEPAFDKDYLGQSASSDYLKSLEKRIASERAASSVAITPLTTATGAPATSAPSASAPSTSAPDTSAPSTSAPATDSGAAFGSSESGDASLIKVPENVVPLLDAKEQNIERIIEENKSNIAKIEKMIEAKNKELHGSLLTIEDTQYLQQLKDNILDIERENAIISSKVGIINDMKRDFQNLKEEIKAENDKREGELFQLEELNKKKRQYNESIERYKNKLKSSEMGSSTYNSAFDNLQVKTEKLSEVKSKISQMEKDISDRRLEWITDFNKRAEVFTPASIDGIIGVLSSVPVVSTAGAGAGAGAGASAGAPFVPPAPTASSVVAGTEPPAPVSVLESVVTGSGAPVVPPKSAGASFFTAEGDLKVGTDEKYTIKKKDLESLTADETTFLITQRKEFDGKTKKLSIPKSKFNKLSQEQKQLITLINRKLDPTIL